MYMIKPHDLIEVTGPTQQYFYRVTGVHLGGMKSASVITLEPVNEAPPWFGESSCVIAVPLVLIEAGLSKDAFRLFSRVEAEPSAAPLPQK